MFRALFWPSPTCMHVSLWKDQAIPAGARKTTISHEQYRRLVEYILGSFRRDADGRCLLIEGGAYGGNDAFYHAHGSYHALNTCNCWVGRRAEGRRRADGMVHPAAENGIPLHAHRPGRMRRVRQEEYGPRELHAELDAAPDRAALPYNQR